MNLNEHLTKKQLSEYSVGALNRISYEEIGRHLLNCDPCRTALPTPSVSQFRAALMLENSDVQQLSIGSMDSDWHRTFSEFLSFFRGKQSVVVTGMALILLLSIYFLTFVKSPWKSNPELDIARNNQSDATSPVPYISEDQTFGAQNPFLSEKTDGYQRNPTNRTVTLPTTRGGNEKSVPNKSFRGNSGSSPSREGPGARKPNVSTTRGIPSKCGDLKPIDFEFTRDNGSVSSPSMSQL